MMEFVFYGLEIGEVEFAAVVFVVLHLGDAPRDAQRHVQQNAQRADEARPRRERGRRHREPARGHLVQVAAGAAARAGAGIARVVLAHRVVG